MTTSRGAASKGGTPAFVWGHMAHKPVEYVTPRKGKVSFDSYAEAAIDAALDALNVMPFDDVGLARMGQRAGTSKLWPSAIGSGSEAVSTLVQTTIALDPTTVEADTLLLNEPFTYANGNLHDVGGAGTTWRVSTGAGSGVVLATDADGFLVDTNTTKENNSATSSTAAVYQPALTLGQAYVLRATINLNTTGSAPGSSTLPVGLICRVDKSSYGTATDILAVRVGLGGIQIMKSSSVVASYDFPTDYAAGVYDLELRMNGNVVQAWFNGILYLNYTSTTSTNVGVGFCMRNDNNAADRLDDFKVYTGTNLASYRQTDIIAVAGDDVCIGDIDTQAAVVTGGTGAAFAGSRPEVAVSAGQAYIVDGFSILQLDIALRELTTYAATAGTAPEQCTLACMWRDRLILAAPRDNPQNFFATRVGTHTDWDYSQTDSSAAFAGNAATAGRIGDPITALIPASDDVLIIGGDHNIWAIRGDPADGGSIDLISDAIGVLGPRAWTKSPDGTIYFVGSGGFYRMPAGGGEPQLLSDRKLNKFFRDIDRGTHYITLAWHRDRQGCFIFVTPANTGSATHLWYDARTESFWPVQFPDSHGPLCALVYDGDDADDRQILLGGRSGYVQKYDETTPGSDDGTAINSYIIWGPTKFSDVVEAVMEWADVILAKPSSGLADSDINVTFSVLSGPTVERAYNSPRYTRGRTFSRPRRQSRLMLRTRGNSFLLKLANSTLNKTWGFEKAIAMYLPGGLVRRFE